MSKTMSDFFLDGDTPENVSEIDRVKRDYIVDISSIKKGCIDRARKLARENNSKFEKENIVKEAEFKWLDKVSTILLSPTSRDIESQVRQLGEFIISLKSKASKLEREHLPNHLPEGYSEYLLGFDTETTGLDTRVIYDHEGRLASECLLVGLSLAPTKDEGYYLPVRHTEEDGVLNWHTEAIAEFVGRLCQEFCLIIHNSMYDRQVLALNGVKEFRGYPYFFDTQILYFLLDTDKKRYGLKHLSHTLLNRKMIDIWDLFTSSPDSEFLRFDVLSATNAYVYACSDATNTLYLFQHLFEVKANTNPLVCQPKPMEIDHNFVDTLIILYRQGFPVDVHYSAEALKDLIFRIKLLEKSIHSEVGKPIDIASNKQLATLIFDEFKVPPLEGAERNKQGQYPVDEDALEKLEKLHPNLRFLSMVVLYRKLVGMVSKYFSKFILNSFVDYLHPFSRVCVGYSMTTAPTSRLSSASTGGLDRVVVKEGKKSFSMKFVGSKGECGFNSQAVFSSNYILHNSKKITKLPAEVQDIFVKMEEDAMVDLVRTLATGKADVGE